jgi:hypothetical protein
LPMALNTGCQKQPRKQWPLGSVKLSGLSPT